MSFADSGSPNLKFWDDEKGFHVRRYTGISVDLNFDGTYHGSKKSFERCTDTVFTKVCRTCEDAPSIPMANIILKSRSLGATSMSDFMHKTMRCRYSFRFFSSQDTYGLELVGESIGYNDGNKFSNIDIFFSQNSSSLISGTFSTTSINDIINGRVFIPTAINLSKVKTLDEYLNKYNLLMTFS